MASENHQYVPIKASHLENQHADACSSGSNGGSDDISKRHGKEDGSMEEIFYLEHVGRVSATLSDTHLLWTLVEDEQGESVLCCCGTTLKDTEGHVPLIEIFAVETLGLGLVAQDKSFTSLAPKQLHRLEVHTFLRSGDKWVPKLYHFAHTSGVVVQEWKQRMQGFLLEQSCRPKSVLVFVNPYGGKGSGTQTWKKVESLFEHAKIRVTVVTTERAGHAHDIMSRATKDELNALDGVIVVGGDGFFNEVLNGLVLNRHKAPVALLPRRLNSFFEKRTQQRHSKDSLRSTEKVGFNQLLPSDEIASSEANLEQHPLMHHRSLPALAGIGQEGKRVGTSIMSNPSGPDSAVIDTIAQVKEELEKPYTTLANSNPNLRLGIIPAGSTDTVVISTTGSRDPITSALHIILGDTMPLDIVRVTGWKSQRDETATSEVPEVRYAASFAGSYEAEISFLDIPQAESDPPAEMPQGPWIRKKPFISRQHDSKKVVCVANCAVCASASDFSDVLNSESDTEHVEGLQAPTWKTFQTKFHSIGAAVMSCRNDKAPEGVSAHAHLADGLLHLILIKACSRPEYLRQLICLARRGADPFDFPFVEHCKTPLFTVSTSGDKESVWSVDGELLQARQLTSQVFRGLVNVFARGPES